MPRLASCCARCAVPLPAAGTCGQCLRHAPHFDDALAAFEYRFPLDRLVQRFKYAGDLAIGKWLASRLAERVRGAARPDLIVAVPLTSARLRGRGFNQAVIVAKTVAREIDANHAVNALARLRDTEPQPGLTRAERRANLRDAFACALRFDGEHVALVDDVVTTGATADEIARVLKRAGAGRVSVWSVARTPDPRGA
jgi:ComF family protein